MVLTDFRNLKVCNRVYNFMWTPGKRWQIFGLMAGLAGGIASLSAFAETPPNQFVIPLVANAPQVDGSLSSGEWDHAVALSGFIDQFDGVASARPVTFYLQADSQNLYIAQRSNLRSGEAAEWDPKTLLFQTKPTWFEKNDNAVMVSLAAGRKVNADVPSIVQLAFNVFGQVWKNEWAPLWSGVKFVMPQQNFRVPNGMVVKNQVDAAGTSWTSEVSIPLKDLGVTDFKEGEEWKILLARDYPMGDQTAWTLSGNWRFADRWTNTRSALGIALRDTYLKEENYARATFSSTAPVVRVKSLGNLVAGEVKPEISIFNPDKAPHRVKVSLSAPTEYGAGEPPPAQTLELAVPAGSEVPVELQSIQAAAEFASTLRLTVTDQSGSALLEQSVPLRPELHPAGRSEVPDLSLASGMKKISNRGSGEISAYDPLLNHLNLEITGRKMQGDLKAYDLAVSVRKAGELEPLLRVDPIRIADAKPVHEQPALWRIERIVSLPKLQPGVYEVMAQSRTEEGTPIEEARLRFIRYDHAKELPWLDNQAGISDKILEPWTPIKAETKGSELSLQVVDRDLTVDGSGFWTQVKTKGENLLSRPVRLEISRNGSRVDLQPAAKPLLEKNAPNEVRWKGELSGGGWTAEVQGRLEYDGYNEFRVKLTPPADNGSVDSIRLVVPLRAENARFLHSTGGYWMRDQVSSIGLPDQPGPLWNSGMSKNPKYNGSFLTVGNFKPYVWIGSARLGLAFMADSDQGWVPDDTKTVSAIEVVREGDAVSLILNLVARPFVFNHSREVVFALQPTPVKPLDPDWRARRAQLHIQTAFAPSTADGWSLDGQKWKSPNGLMYGGRHGNQHFPLKWDLNRQRLDDMQAGRKPAGGFKPGGSPFLPYQILNGVVSTEVVDERVPGLQGTAYIGYLGPQIISTIESSFGSITKAEMEHRLFRYQRWAKEVPIMGFYFDNSFPGMSGSPGAGEGYVLDLPDRPNLNGKIQAGYNLGNMREFFKRLRTIIVEEGRRPLIWVHATDSQMVSAYAFADVLFIGENYPTLNDKFPWTSDKFGPAEMQVMHSQNATGLPTNMLDMWGGFATKEMNQLARRNANGWRMVHDTDGSGVTSVDWSGLNLKESADFLPYWDEAIAGALRAGTPEVYVSAWRQKGGLRVAVFNRNADAQPGTKISIDPAALGLKIPAGGWQLNDVENPDQPLAGASNGKDFEVSLDLPGHDYRLFTLTPKSEAR